MNDVQIDDLKTFMATNLANQLSGAINELEARISQRIDQLESRFGQLEVKVDDGFAAIAAILNDHNDVTDDHEVRITKLEQRAA